MAEKSKPEDEDLEIVLDDPGAGEAVEKSEIEVLKAEDAPIEGEKKAIEPDEGIETLRAQLAAERAGKETERQRRIEAENRAASAGENVQETNLSLVTNAIEMIKQTGDTLETNYAQAMTDGDYAAAAKVQRQMAANEAKLQTLEAGKVSLEEEAKRPREAPRYNDPVEEFAANLSAPSAAWVRAHPEYATDPKLNRRMIRAHEDAIDEGLAADSSAYFAAVERELGIGRREEPVQRREESALSEAAEPVQRRQSPPPNAPVSRNGSGNGSAPTTVRLTAAEREMAANMGQSDKEYALAKQALIREGKLN